MVKRKEYQYESRHIHATRRARGPGGKFLSKKTTIEACTTLHPEYKPPERQTYRLQKMAKFIAPKLEFQQKLILKIINEKIQKNDFLVPINIIEDSIRDTFLYNLSENSKYLPEFIEFYCLEKNIPEKVEKKIFQNVQDQLTKYYNIFSAPSVSEEELKSLDTETNDKSILVPIVIDIRLGDYQLKDKFEWDLCNKFYTPEMFANQFITDMKLIKEFVPLISYSMHEQIILHMERILEGGASTKSTTCDFRDMFKEGDFVRDSSEIDDWSPSISKLNKHQINELSAKEDRRLRYKRRHGNSTTTTDYDLISKSISSSTMKSLLICSHCGVSENDTPLMRKGPAGEKSLCNKCGIAWQSGRLNLN